MTGLGDTARLARDSFYVGIGFGVLGFQKLQVRRRELERDLRRRREDPRGPRGLVEDGVGLVGGGTDAVLGAVSTLLPPPLRDPVEGARARVPGRGAAAGGDDEPTAP